MRQDPDLLREVCGWVVDAATIPVWAKMTPSVTQIVDPARAALQAGCHGIYAINTGWSRAALTIQRGHR